MALFPLGIPLGLILGMFSLFMVGAGGYLLWLWWTGTVTGAVYLGLAMAPFIWTISGRWIALALLGRAGTDDPRDLRDGTVHRLQRVDGSVLHVECYGPAEAPPLVLAPAGASIAPSSIT
jgi:hypothetical protein